MLQILEAAKNNKSFPKYLAIEGPIGVGKTTLAKRLANLLDYPLLLESVTENPFLDRFYSEGTNQALPTQLFFLLQRAKQVQDMPGNDLLDRALVTDFMSGMIPGCTLFTLIPASPFCTALDFVINRTAPLDPLYPIWTL